MVCRLTYVLHDTPVTVPLQGAGALIASRDMRRNLTPLIHGGGQEKSLRSGTQNVPGIVGFGKACAVSYKIMPDE